MIIIIAVLITPRLMFTGFYIERKFSEYVMWVYELHGSRIRIIIILFFYFRIFVINYMLKLTITYFNSFESIDYSMTGNCYNHIENLLIN